jgi:hypothetical protein
MGCSCRAGKGGPPKSQERIALLTQDPEFPRNARVRNVGTRAELMRIAGRREDWRWVKAPRSPLGGYWRSPLVGNILPAPAGRFIEGEYVLLPESFWFFGK